MTASPERFQTLMQRYAEKHGIEAGELDAKRLPAEAINVHLPLLNWWRRGGELSIADHGRLRRLVAYMRPDTKFAPIGALPPGATQRGRR